MKVRNNTGPRTVPCGMPDFGDRHDDLKPLTQTHCLRFVRKFLSQESEERENPSAYNFPIRPGMPTRSYALLGPGKQPVHTHPCQQPFAIATLYEEAELCDGGVIRKKPRLVLKDQRM